MGNRQTLEVTLLGEGSAQRSALAPFESHYWEFIDVDGVEYRWYSDKKLHYSPGDELLVTATVTPARTLQRPEFRAKHPWLYLQRAHGWSSGVAEVAYKYYQGEIEIHDVRRLVPSYAGEIIKWK